MAHFIDPADDHLQRINRHVAAGNSLLTLPRGKAPSRSARWFQSRRQA